MPSTVTNRLQGVTTSVAVKAPCRTVATSNITLAGLQTIGSVTVTDGDRVLVTAQSTGSENGIYESSTGLWTRSPDFDGELDVVQGTLVPVVNGSGGVNLYEVTTSNDITIGTTSIAFSLRYGANVRYDQTDAEIAAGVTPTNYAYPPGDVRRYGAVLDGTTDDTDAFQAAWKLKNPYAPAGSTVISGSIPIIANQSGKLDGTVINIVGSVEVFTSASGVNDWDLIGPAQIIGDNDSAGSTLGTGAAVKVTSGNRYRVKDITAMNIKGWGFRRTGASATPLGDQGTFENCHAYACYIGDESEPNAEYCKIIGGNITKCDTGVIATGGNTLYSACNIVENTKGVRLIQGSNHGHGIFSGCQINHNVDYNIFSDTVTNGHTFDGCHIYEGMIHFKNSTGVIIRGGIVDVAEYRFQECDGCGFDGCTMMEGYDNTITNNYSGSGGFVLWRNCVDAMGAPFNGGAGNIQGVKVTSEVASDITISAANVNAGFDIKLDDTQNASANNTSQTSYDGYVVGTGIYTCRKGGLDGKVRVSATIGITNNAADTNKFSIVLSHSALGGYYLAKESQSTTLTYFTGQFELPIEQLQTVKLRIAGSGVANDVIIEATATHNTRVLVEGL